MKEIYNECVNKLLFLFNFRGMKKIIPLVLLPIILTFSSILAQDDVSLFDYWKYYSDIENIQYKNLCSEAFKLLDKREKDVSFLRSKEDWLKRQQLVGRKLKNLIGPFPEKTSLNARVTGVLKRDGYRVEKLIYESMPGYFVTAALFIPNKIRGKARPFSMPLAIAPKVSAGIYTSMLLSIL